MRKFLTTAIVSAIFASAASAATVTQLDNFAVLAAQTYGASPPHAINIAGHSTATDGGGGTFVYKSTGCSSDNGVYLTDATTPTANCFYRQFNGPVHLLWYGISSSSTGSDVATAISAAFTAAENAGYRAVNTDGIVNLKVTSNIELPPDMDFDCGATPDAQRTNADFSAVPGSLALAHGVSITRLTTDQNTSLHNCTIVSQRYLDLGVPATIRAELTLLADMVSDADTAVTCGEQGCNDHDLLILGFDTAYQMTNAPNNVVNNIKADADVCFWAASTGGAANWGSSLCYPFLTHQLNATHGSNNDANSEWWTITAIANDGAGHCKLTVSSTADIVSGDTVWVSKINHPAQCTGRWIATVSDGTHVVLNTSSFAGPTRTATTTTGSPTLTSVSNTANIYPGDAATGTGIPASTTVVAVYRARNAVVLSANATASGSGVSVTFSDSGTFSSSTCDGTGAGTCLWISAGSRVYAGTSAGGNAAGNVATGYMIGGPDSSYKFAGFTAVEPFSFGHDVQFHVENSNETGFSMAGADNDGNIDDPNTMNVLVDGTNNNVEFLGRKSGKNGVSVLINDSGDGCTNYEAQNAASTTGDLASFELDNGCAIILGTRTSSKSVALVSNGSSSPVFFANNNLTQTDFYYDDASARARVIGSGNNFELGGINNFNGGGVFNNNVGIGAGTQPPAVFEVLQAGTAQTSSNINSLSSSGTGSIAVGSTTGWPSPGVLLVDSEFMTYTVLNGGHLTITGRGAFGSTGATHANGATVSYRTLLAGTSSSALPVLDVGTSLARVNAPMNAAGAVQTGSLSSATTQAGDVAQTKETDAGTAAGAGFCKVKWVAGTNVGTGKLIAYCGTSATPVTIIDNVGAGF